MKRARAWWMLAVLVGCADADVGVRGPGLDVAMDEDEGPIDVPGEDIPVSGEAPTCPPGWNIMIFGRVVTCVPPSDPPGFPDSPDDPGGSSGGPGSNPSDDDDDGDDDDDDAEDRADARYRERMRQRNNACIASCVTTAVATAVDCRTFDGYVRPTAEVCPFGARLDDPDFCPGFWELCVYNRVRPVGGPPEVDACFDANGDFVRDAPGCQAEVQSCIASWEQFYNPFDWTSCIQDLDGAFGCAQSCFAQYPVDGAMCFGAIDGTSVEGQMDGTLCQTSSGAFVDCAALGQTTCSY